MARRWSLFWSNVLQFFLDECSNSSGIENLQTSALGVNQQRQIILSQAAHTLQTSPDTGIPMHAVQQSPTRSTRRQPEMRSVSSRDHGPSHEEMLIAGEQHRLRDFESETTQSATAEEGSRSEESSTLQALTVQGYNCENWEEREMELILELLSMNNNLLDSQPEVSEVSPEIASLRVEMALYSSREKASAPYSHLEGDIWLLKQVLEDEPNKTKDVADKNECKICYDSCRDTLILPCFHYQYCNVCLQKERLNSKRKVMNRVRKRKFRCPSCRSSVWALPCWRIPNSN